MPLAWSGGLFTKVCAARINYLGICWFLHYPLSVWSHIFTECSQGGKLTSGNISCPFNKMLIYFNKCQSLKCSVRQITSVRGKHITTKDNKVCGTRDMSTLKWLRCWNLEYDNLLNMDALVVIWPVSVLNIGPSLISGHRFSPKTKVSRPGEADWPIVIVILSFLRTVTKKSSLF